MNKDILKKPTFWVAVVVALSGVAMSQGLILDGSKPAEVVGWVVALLGSFFGGKASLPAPSSTDTPST